MASVHALCVRLLCALMFLFSACAQNYGRFWHVTDFHYDHTYNMTSQPLSCNAEMTSLPAIGDYWCDATWTLVTKAINAMKTIRFDVDFLLWTGDTVAHIKDTNLSVSINLDIVANITNAIKAAFPNTQIFSTFGNHDYYPASQFPAQVSANLDNLLYNSTAQLWKDWIQEDEQMQNFRKGGYYTRLLHTTSNSSMIRLVLLNTNLYYTSNKQTIKVQDPSGQFKWLRDTLQQAKDNSEKVLLAAHIPPGIHTPRGVQWYQEDFVQPFSDAVSAFSDVIIAMHFGHDHHDGFKVFPGAAGKPSIPIFVAPSVTPWRFKIPDMIGPPHNPSLRLVTFDRDTGKHVNIQQYHLDLAAAVKGGNDAFSPLYSFTEHYGVSDLSATSLSGLIARMRNETARDSPLLDSYYRYTLVGAEDEEGCDINCKAKIVCGFTLFNRMQYDACVAASTISQGPTVMAAISTLLSLVFLALVFR